MASKGILHLFQLMIIITCIFIQLIIQFVVDDWFDIWMGVPYTVSGWLIGLTLAYWIDSTNVLLNSFLMLTFFPLLFIVIYNITLGNFYDFLHISVVLTQIGIILRKSEFRMKYGITFTPIFFVWVWGVWATGVAYSYYSLWFMIGLTVGGILGLLFLYALVRYKGYLASKSTAESLTPEALKAIQQELHKIELECES